MTDSKLPAQAISNEERQGTIDRLCRHFAADHLDTFELERRLDLAYAATDRAELTALERGLPALDRARQPASDVAEPVGSGSAEEKALVDTGRPVSDRDLMISVMGATERSGAWTPPRTLTALSFMGGATIDYREAAFGTREVSLRLFALMGGVEIIVPPGTRVEWNGIAIMGGVGIADLTEPGPGAPLIRIEGLVMMGGVDIVERRRGETAREARKRLKAERKARKRLESGE